MNRVVKYLTAAVLTVGAALAAVPAQARTPGQDSLIHPVQYHRPYHRPYYAHRSYHRPVYSHRPYRGEYHHGN